MIINTMTLFWACRPNAFYDLDKSDQSDLGTCQAIHFCNVVLNVLYLFKKQFIRRSGYYIFQGQFIPSIF